MSLTPITESKGQYCEKPCSGPYDGEICKVCQPKTENNFIFNRRETLESSLLFFPSFCSMLLLGLLPSFKLKTLFAKGYEIFFYLFRESIFRTIFPQKEKFFVSENIIPIEKNKLNKEKKEMKGHSVCIRFSGGVDSTLVAACAASKFDKVHLLTFTHSALSFLGNTKTALKRLKTLKYLKRKYGQNKFKHKLIDVDPLLKKLYFKRLYRDILRYGLIRLRVCSTCQFAMHLATIDYCLQKGIKHVTDGATTDASSYAFSMQPKNFEEIKKMYASYGIKYLINPQYNTIRSDHALYNLGITPVKNLKGEKDYYKNYQQKCAFGSLGRDFVENYYIKVHGKKSLGKIAQTFYKDKITQYGRTIT